MVYRKLILGKKKTNGENVKNTYKKFIFKKLSILIALDSFF